ncbi:MAG: putative sulfate exporter family transporter [Cyclobacteriaceae bacterium]
MKLISFRTLIIVGSVSCLLPFVNASVALVLGIGLALLFKGKQRESFQDQSSLLLKVSIVLMGFGMNLSTAISTSAEGIGLTFFSVILTLLLGIGLGKIMKVDKKTTVLISVGTAICGGSAIAAMSPVIRAKGEQISFSLIVIFLFNAIALLIFPLIGEFLELSQQMFGKWAAIAIHDTSSVVGAGSAYGAEALEVAATVKLTRALWIVPVTIAFSLFQREVKTKPKFPWFILFFVLAMTGVALFPYGSTVFDGLSWIGKRGMVIALFLIGSTFDGTQIRRVGLRTFLLGILLWLIIALSSLITIQSI